QTDIAEGRLRAVGPTGNVYDDAVARFTEDGLRVMRAVRFAAALEFALDPDTERAIGPALRSLAKVSKERISDELRKILATRAPPLRDRAAPAQVLQGRVAGRRHSRRHRRLGPVARLGRRGDPAVARGHRALPRRRRGRAVARRPGERAGRSRGGDPRPARSA